MNSVFSLYMRPVPAVIRSPFFQDHSRRKDRLFSELTYRLIYYMLIQAEGFLPGCPPMLSMSSTMGILCPVYGDSGITFSFFLIYMLYALNMYPSFALFMGI